MQTPTLKNHPSLSIAQSVCATLLAAGCTVGDCCTALARSGCRTPRGGRSWDRKQVRRIMARTQHASRHRGRVKREADAWRAACVRAVAAQVKAAG